MQFDPQSNIIVSEAGDAAVAGGKPQGGGRGGQIVAVITLAGVVGAGVAVWSFFGPRMASASDTPTPIATTIGEIRPVAPTEAPPIVLADEEDTLDRLDGVRQATNHLLLMREADRLMSRGRHSEAIPLLEEVIDIRPHHDQARYKLGLAYARTGNQDGLRLQTVALNELDPNLGNLLGNLVR